MLFEDRSFETILQEMLEAIPPDMDKREGGVIYNALAPAAMKLFESYIALEQVLVLMFPQTSQGEYLDFIVWEENIIRHRATPSVRHFEANGLSGTISEGDRFFVDDIYFVAKETISIPGIFRAESEEVGRLTAIYNPRTILPIENTAGLEGLAMIHKHENDIDGIDDETDESLLERYWDRVRDSPGPGNNADYRRWAKEITGVGNVLVDPLWQGEGTVLVIILTPEGREAPRYLIDAVQEYLDPNSEGRGEGKAPPGARVTVTTADGIAMYVTVPNLQIQLGYVLEQVRTNVKEAIEDYLLKVNPGGVIRIREIESQIINTEGVLDVGDVLVNGKRENVELDIVQLVTVSEVNFI